MRPSFPYVLLDRQFNAGSAVRIFVALLASLLTFGIFYLFLTLELPVFVLVLALVAIIILGLWIIPSYVLKRLRKPHDFSYLFLSKDHRLIRHEHRGTTFEFENAGLTIVRETPEAWVLNTALHESLVIQKVLYPGNFRTVAHFIEGILGASQFSVVQLCAHFQEGSLVFYAQTMGTGRKHKISNFF